MSQEEVFYELGGKKYSLADALTKMHSTIKVLQTSEGAVKTRLADEEARSESYKRQIEQLTKELDVLKGTGAGGSGGSGDVPRPSKSFSLLNSVPDFEGSAKDDVQSFISKLEQASKLGGWSPSETLLAARQKLIGTALQVVQADAKMMDISEFRELKEFLIQRFKKKNTQRFYREKLSRMRKEEKETIEEFADRIKIVNSNTYEIVQGADKQEVNAAILREADQRALDAFLNGLPAHLGEKVRMALPQTLEDAVARGISMIEANRRVRGEEPRREIFTIECYNCGQAGHTKAVCRNRPKCYNCNRMGHMASACRSTPQRGQQNQVMQSAESAEVAQHYPRGRGRGRGEFRGRGSYYGRSGRGQGQQREQYSLIRGNEGLPSQQVQNTMEVSRNPNERGTSSTPWRSPN